MTAGHQIVNQPDGRAADEEEGVDLPLLEFLGCDVRGQLPRLDAP